MLAVAAASRQPISELMELNDDELDLFMYFVNEVGSVGF